MVAALCHYPYKHTVRVSATWFFLSYFNPFSVPDRNPISQKEPNEAGIDNHSAHLYQLP